MNGRISIEERVSGCLIGSAVGDALGGPMECVPAEDNLRIFGEVKQFEDVTAEMITAAGRARGKVFWTIDMWGQVTDDTALCDLLIDCMLRHDGQITAYAFAEEWTRLDQPVHDDEGREVNRLAKLHWIERIPFLRNRLRTINKRELGRGEAQATNVLMFIAPVGLLCAGQPLEAELMAVDIGSVNQHGVTRDVAGGYAAAVASCFLPDATVESIIDTAVRHTRDERSVHEINAILELARGCASCEQFVHRYWREIVGSVVPRQDWQHHGSGSITTWNNSEVLGTALGLFQVTGGGEDGVAMLRYAAMNGRDADTTCRVAGGLLGAWRGVDAIPATWRAFVLNRNTWLQLEAKSAKLAELIRRRLRRQQDVAAAVLGAGEAP